MMMMMQRIIHPKLLSRTRIEGEEIDVTTLLLVASVLVEGQAKKNIA
jgi:hypothetical protein